MLANVGFHPKWSSCFQIKNKQKQRKGYLFKEVQAQYLTRFCSHKGAYCIAHCWGRLNIKKHFTGEGGIVSPFGQQTPNTILAFKKMREFTPRNGTCNTNAKNFLAADTFLHAVWRGSWSAVSSSLTCFLPLRGLL